MDIRENRAAMLRTWPNPEFKIPLQFHVDIQDHFRVNDKVRTGMAMLAKVLLSNFYTSMKANLPPGGHHHWENMPLGETHVQYAAIDGFVSFELYHQIKIIERAKRTSSQLHHRLRHRQHQSL